MQSGKQCLCRYALPTELGKGFFSNYDLHSEISDTFSDLKITSIADAVEGRINVTCSNGLVWCSCTLSLNILLATNGLGLPLFLPFFWDLLFDNFVYKGCTILELCFDSFVLHQWCLLCFELNNTRRVCNDAFGLGATTVYVVLHRTMWRPKYECYCLSFIVLYIND